MKVLLAVNIESIEDYISSLPYIEVTGIVRQKSEVLSACDIKKPDIVVLSNYLDGSEAIEHIIYDIRNRYEEELRIVFFYGEEDDKCAAFIKYLNKNGIYDCKVGRKLTSKDIESFLNSAKYGVAARSKAEKTVIIKELDQAVIALYSNDATGKTHTAWNLSYCFAERGYRVGLLNIDRGYSANLYYGIGKPYQELLECMTRSGQFGNILDYCYKRRNLSVITGKCGSEEVLDESYFSQLLYNVKSKCDITLVDTRTGLDANTQTALKHSTIDMIVFDSDLQHFHMNMKMLDELENSFIPEKTIVVINNSDIRSSSYRYIYNEVKKLKLPFKGVMPLSSCSSLSQDVMFGDRVPYQFDEEATKDFRKDMDNILEIINCREKRLNVFQRILKR